MKKKTRRQLLKALVRSMLPTVAQIMQLTCVMLLGALIAVTAMLESVRQVQDDTIKCANARTQLYGALVTCSFDNFIIKQACGELEQ